MTIDELAKLPSEYEALCKIYPDFHNYMERIRLDMCNKTVSCDNNNFTTNYSANEEIIAIPPFYGYAGSISISGTQNPGEIVCKQKCPDCKGTKKYVGFNVVEPCKKCNGEGVI